MARVPCASNPCPSSDPLLPTPPRSAHPAPRSAAASAAAPPRSSSPPPPAPCPSPPQLSPAAALPAPTASSSWPPCRARGMGAGRGVSAVPEIGLARGAATMRREAKLRHANQIVEQLSTLQRFSSTTLIHQQCKSLQIRRDHLVGHCCPPEKDNKFLLHGSETWKVNTLSNRSNLRLRWMYTSSCQFGLM